jgi:hypothetical protein
MKNDGLMRTVFYYPIIFTNGYRSIGYRAWIRYQAKIDANRADICQE